MRCAVIAAVLLLVYIQDVAAVSKRQVSSMCKSKHPPNDCGGGWFRIDPRRCAKYFMEKKTFWGAENHCRSLGSHLVSIHNINEHNNVLCLALRTTNNRDRFWIGLFLLRKIRYNKWTDGTRYDFSRWNPHQPNFGWEKCADVNYEDWGRWNNEYCGHTRYFVCAKNM